MRRVRLLAAVVAIILISGTAARLHAGDRAATLAAMQQPVAPVASVAAPAGGFATHSP
jgi:hypothetical protein